MRENHLSHESLIPPNAATVLDVGCGRGGNAAWLNQKGITVDAVSWRAEELAAAKQFCRRVIQCDLNNGIPDIGAESYDGIICSHVLEHIAYPQKLLDDVVRALVPGGFLLVVIPNLFFWSDRVKLALGRWDYQESGTFDYTHLRWYTAKSMHRLLSSFGFVSDQFVAEGWIPLPGLRFILGAELRKRVNTAACRMSPGLFGKQLIFRFRKTRRAGSPSTKLRAGTELGAGSTEGGLSSPLCGLENPHSCLRVSAQGGPLMSDF